MRNEKKNQTQQYKKISFTQVFVVEGIIVWRSFRQNHEFIPFNAKLRYRQVLFSQLLMSLKLFLSHNT